MSKYALINSAIGMNTGDVENRSVCLKNVLKISLRNKPPNNTGRNILWGKHYD